MISWGIFTFIKFFNLNGDISVFPTAFFSKEFLVKGISVMKISIKSMSGSILALGVALSVLTGCATTEDGSSSSVMSSILPGKSLDERYTQTADEKFRVAPLDSVKIPEQFQRTVVSYPTKEVPGTIIVEPRNHYLYLVTGNGKAIRYGVGVGAAGLGFQGDAVLQSKQKWPRWIPTKDMIARNPAQYKKYENGVDGGYSSPLGARALYLFQNGKDTYYRIHGTTQPSSIGKSVSAGCIRMLNNDVVDLYERAPIGAKVIVR